MEVDAIKMQLNDEHYGVELIIPGKISKDMLAALKERSFRWHGVKGLWYAVRTPERMAFARKITKESREAIQKEKATAQAKEDDKRIKENKDPESNCFASYYDKIGDTPILDSADNTHLYDVRDAYIRDLNIYYRRTYSGDAITVVSLEGAGRRGATCKEWRIYPGAGNDGVKVLSEKENIHTIRELYEALTSGREFSRVVVHDSTSKGIDTFSPFMEYKGIGRTPANNNWNKTNFTQALLSGQIFQGEITQHLTDDYAMDAAYNFSSGVPVSIPSTARKAVEDWSSLAYIYTDKTTRDGFLVLHYSCCNTSKEFLFDLNCNIKEAKRREEERKAGIESYNNTLKASCITLKAESVDPAKVYTLETVEPDSNTGICTVKSEVIQGHVLRDRLDPPYMDILAVKEFSIQPDLMYSVCDFHRRMPASETLDERIIQCGNFKGLVTGKALSELTAEGHYLPSISLEQGEYGPTADKALATLRRFESGQVRSMFTGDRVNFTREIHKLEREHERTTQRKPGLDSIIAGAQKRTEPAEQGRDRNTSLVRD